MSMGLHAASSNFILPFPKVIRGDAESFPLEGRALDTLLKMQADKGTKPSFLHLSCFGFFRW